jgi:transmembrane sensor
MSAEEVESIAADWLAREDRGLSAEESSQMEIWLEQSVLHKVSYLRLKEAWQRADRLAALKAPAMMMKRDRRRASPVAGLAVAAGLTLLVGSAAWMLWPSAKPAGGDFATGVGHMESLRLADGTQVELNTNTRLHTDLTAASRTVMLESGEAYFDVAHDDKRPFTVYAGNRRITDIGTKFSVFRDGDDVRVTVREGKVRVDVLNQAVAPVLAEAGHVVVTKGGETLVIQKDGTQITDDLSWRDGVLVFHQQTLAEAADQFNRYNERQILVEGPARKIRIGGRFKADNVDVFVLLLHRGFGLSVNEQGRTIVVSR